MITAEDRKLYRKFQKSPILFIEKMWGLTPQPLLPQYVDIAKSKPLKKYKEKWFGEFIRGEHITWQQWVILLAVEKALRGEALKRISVRSGHGIGKDATLSWLIAWYLFCFKNAQVPCTAPTSEQIHDILWKEVKIWLDRMPERISELYDWQSGHIRMTDSPETWFARARTSRKESPEALAGVHGEFVFFAIDEASGIPLEIFQTAEGALTGDNVLVVMIGNMIRLLGYFYDSHHKDSHNWQTFTFDSEESPIVNWEFVDRIEEMYGRDSDEFRVRVQGLAPREDAVDDRGYVPLFKEEDINWGDDIPFVGDIRLGLDVAGAGRDKTEWGARDNFRAKILLSEAISTPKTVAQKSVTLFTEYEIDPQDTWIDNFGEGANVATEIALVDNRKLRTNPVSFGDSPENSTRFLNKRAEMYWRLRQWAKSGGLFVRDEKLREQLLSIRYTETLSGKMQIMSKKEMRKQGLPSPDKADALALTFYKDKDQSMNAPNYEQPKRGNKYRPRIRK